MNNFNLEPKLCLHPSTFEVMSPSAQIFNSEPKKQLHKQDVCSDNNKAYAPGKSHKLIA